MDILAHLTGLSLIAAIITGMGVALAALHAVALRLSVRHWPRQWLAAGVVAVPFLGWMGFGLYLLSLMAADPTAANLWPLTLALAAFCWLGWMAVTAVVAAVVRFFRPV